MRTRVNKTFFCPRAMGPRARTVAEAGERGYAGIGPSTGIRSYLWWIRGEEIRKSALARLFAVGMS